MQSLLNTVLAQLNPVTNGGNVLQLLALLLVMFACRLIARSLRQSQALARIQLKTGAQARLLEAMYLIAPFLLALVLCAMLSGFMHALKATPTLLDACLPLIGLLLLVRLAVYLFRISAGDHAPIRGWGNTITLIIWVALSLHLLGWYHPVVQALDSAGMQLGNTRISLWSIIRLLFTVSAFVLVAIWLSRWIERQLLSVKLGDITTRLSLAKFAQAGLIGLSVLLGLNAAGLDLTALNVLTGAIGIGLGFGLQSIASNFVSGFVLLMDRSIKPGDVISFSGVSGTTTEAFGWVQELRGRYVVVRDRDGVETLVPNQQLINNPVINWSYTDPRIRLKLPVRIGYECDVEQALTLLLTATDKHPRILNDPPPVSRLMSFGDYGLELELRFWITDPQEGVNNVRSDVNRAIWHLFQQHGIRVPVPQRDVRLTSAPSANEP